MMNMYKVLKEHRNLEKICNIYNNKIINHIKDNNSNNNFNNKLNNSQETK